MLLIGELSSLSFSRPARCSTEDKAGVTLACSRSEPATPGLGVGGAPANCHIVDACVSVSRLRRPCRRRRCDCEAMAAVLERAGAWHGNGTVPLIVGAGADAQASGGATTWCYPRYPEDSSATCEIIESNHIWKILI